MSDRCEMCGCGDAFGGHAPNCPGEPRPSEATEGLHRKYSVRRLNDDAGKHHECEFFVLDWLHDKFAVPAMRAYADACEVEFPVLADELRKLAGFYERRRNDGSL